MPQFLYVLGAVVLIVVVSLVTDPRSSSKPSPAVTVTVTDVKTERAGTCGPRVYTGFRFVVVSAFSLARCCGVGGK